MIDYGQRAHVAHTGTARRRSASELMKGVVLAGGKGTRLHPLTRITNKDAYQENEGGIAEALGLAARCVGGDRVAVALADNLFERSVLPAVQNFAVQDGGARILLARIDDVKRLRHLGVAEIDGDRVLRIVEKPDEPASPFAVTGFYLYDSSVFEVMAGLDPSERGELEITDVNNWYVVRGEMAFEIIDGFWGDAGESIDAYHDVNDFVRRHGANR
jgi:glucose-1-phosphate thymidylyltransferase